MNYTDIIDRRKFLRYFGCCTCGLMISSCTTVPITERRQLKIIPESTLNRQAAQIYEKVKSKENLSKDLDQLEEIKEDGHPIIFITGRRLVEIVKEKISPETNKIQEYLEKETYKEEKS